MEDSALLEKLKGLKWDRITAEEDIGLKFLLLEPNQNEKIPYMYNPYLKIMLAREGAQEEQIINCFSALKKLGLLKTLQLNVNLQQRDKPTFKDILLKISDELGKLKILKKLILQTKIYETDQEILLNNIGNIEQLEDLEIYELYQFSKINQDQKFDSVYVNYFSSIFKCQQLKSLKLSLYMEIECSEQLKSELKKFQHLDKLEEFYLQTNISNESFYECLGYQLAKLPKLKFFSLDILSTNLSEAAQYSKNILKLSENVCKSESLTTVTIGTIKAGEQEEYYNKALDLISSIKQLKELRIKAQNNSSNLFDKLNQFTQIESLSFILDQPLTLEQLQGLRNLNQLKALYYNTIQSLTHSKQQEIIQNIKFLKNISFISIPDYPYLIQKIKKLIPYLVEYSIIDHETIEF